MSDSFRSCWWWWCFMLSDSRQLFISVIHTLVSHFSRARFFCPSGPLSRMPHLSPAHTRVRTIISLPGVMDSWGEAVTAAWCPDTDWRWSNGDECWHFHQKSVHDAWRHRVLNKTPPPSERFFKASAVIAARRRSLKTYKKHFSFVHTEIYWIKEFLFHFKMYCLWLREWQLRGANSETCFLLPELLENLWSLDRGKCCHCTFLHTPNTLYLYVLCESY